MFRARNCPEFMLKHNICAIERYGTWFCHKHYAWRTWHSTLRSLSIFCWWGTSSWTMQLGQERWNIAVVFTGFVYRLLCCWSESCNESNAKYKLGNRKLILAQVVQWERNFHVSLFIRFSYRADGKNFLLRFLQCFILQLACREIY